MKKYIPSPKGLLEHGNIIDKLIVVIVGLLYLVAIFITLGLAIHLILTVIAKLLFFLPLILCIAITYGMMMVIEKNNGSKQGKLIMDRTKVCIVGILIISVIVYFWKDLVIEINSFNGYNIF